MRRSTQHDVDLVRLSGRERVLLSLVLEGHPYKQIAAIMEIQESTVRNQVFRMCSDLRVAGKEGLLRWAICHGVEAQADGSLEPAGFVPVAMHAVGCLCPASLRSRKVA